MRVTCHPSFGVIDAARWDDLWRRALQANVYQTQAWYTAYERHLAGPGFLTSRPFPASVQLGRGRRPTNARS